MKKPLVTIAIPNRNYAHYLDECLESVFNQTYDNLEVIVVDNCSTDNSFEVMRKYLDKGLIINKNPLNLVTPLSIPVEFATGKYIMVLCSDDRLRPTFIEKAVNLMEANPDVGLVHAEKNYIDENSKLTPLDPFFNCSFTCPGEDVLPILVMSEIANPAQGLMRRSVFEIIDKVDFETLHASNDWSLWFKLLMKSDYGYLRENLVDFRIHSQQDSVIANQDPDICLIRPLNLYFVIKNFFEIAEYKGYKKVLERKEASLSRLSNSFGMQNVNRAILEGDPEVVRRLLIFLEIIDENIVNHPEYEQAKAFASGEVTSIGSKPGILEAKKRSYDPPENFVVWNG